MPIFGELGIEGNCFVPAKGTHQFASMATKTVFISSFYDLFFHLGGIRDRGNGFVPAKGTHQLASMATKTVFILSFYDVFSKFGGIGG